MKGLQSLATLLARQNQRFVCVDTGWPEPGPRRFTAQIVHYAEPRLGKTQIEQLERLFPDIPQLAEFYSHYASVRLFVDPIGGDSAFYIASPDEWHGLRKNFEMWMDCLDEDEEEDLLPDWMENYIAIGEVPTSGNYYLMPTKGEHTGKVIHFDHDGFEFTEEGVDMSAFLTRIATVDRALIEEILGHTRYSDGETEIQWLAQEYLYDE